MCDICAGIIGQSLLRYPSRVDLQSVVEDKRLIVDGTIRVE